jgi:beta-barrel assembly-enhancing protease
MNEIKGLLFQSENQQLIPARLLVQSGYWIIHYFDPNGHDQTIVWDEHKVRIEKQSLETRFFSKGGSNYFISNDEKLIKRLAPKSFFQDWIYRNPMVKPAGLFLVILMIGCTLVYFSLPSISSALAKAIPIETEKKLGQSLASIYLKDANIHDSLSIKMMAFFDLLEIPSPYEYSIQVIRSDEVNAFAMPGGTIVIYTGLLQKMKAYPALVALLGHESAHVEKRHTLQSLSRHLALSATLQLLFGASDVITMMAGQAANLSGLKYSRKLEKEADESAVKLLTRTQISAKGMVDLMESLQQINTDDHSLEFLESHPLTSKRLEFARAAFASQTQPKEWPALDSIWTSIQHDLKNLGQ